MLYSHKTEERHRRNGNYCSMLDVTNRYDLAGRLVEVADGTGTRTFAYDARGRVTAETNALAVISHEYNTLGLPSGFAADNDGTISYAYDSLMRMTNVCFGTLSFCHGYLPHTRHLESVSNSCGIWAGNAGVFTSRFCGRQK
jgi:YD repeat-containing protein